MKKLKRTENVNFLEAMDRGSLSSEMNYKLYSIIAKYDIPKHADRDFVFDNLIKYFSSIEEFIKCVNLTYWKKNTERRNSLSFTGEDITIKDLDFLKSLGYIVPDSVTKQVLINKY